MCIAAVCKLDGCVGLLLMQAFEGMFSGMKSKTEALELENTQLRDAICLPDLQVCIVLLLHDWCVCVCVCVCVHACVRTCVRACGRACTTPEDMVNCGGGGLCMSCLCLCTHTDASNCLGDRSESNCA